MGRLGRCAIALALLCLLLAVASNLAQTCGTRKVINRLIVNGTESKDGHWPWHVALFHKNRRSLDYACGGAILDENTVLTAAHCLMTPNGIMARERLVVHVGRHRLLVASNHVQVHEAFRLIVHPEYHVNSIQHDIALIKLASDITYTDYIQPICLWNRGEDQNAIVGSWGMVVGFGIDETDSVSDTLREASIPVVDHITCIESNRKAFAFQLTANMICAGNRDEIGACNGDSGGGLFFNYDDVWYVRGVVSFTKLRENALTCDTKEYTVFTDVAKYLRWIEQHKRGQPFVIENEDNRKIRLLPMSTCGANPYGDREESMKPVMLGYPWVGLLEYTETKSLEKRVLRQATLISDLYLITAAQEVEWVLTGYTLTSVRLGEYDTTTKTDCEQMDGQIVCSPPVQTLRIASVITHMNYSGIGYVNDIALIRLRDRADTSQSNVRPICLPVTNELRSPRSSQYIVTSWEHPAGGNLLERSLHETIESTVCEGQFIWMKITIDQICITQQNSTDCRYPMRGSPLQLVQKVQGKSRYVLHGISSSITHCESPGLFINVASYVDWILENMQK